MKRKVFFNKNKTYKLNSDIEKLKNLFDNNSGIKRINDKTDGIISYEFIDTKEFLLFVNSFSLLKKVLIDENQKSLVFIAELKKSVRIVSLIFLCVAILIEALLLINFCKLTHWSFVLLPLLLVIVLYSFLQVGFSLSVKNAIIDFEKQYKLYF